MNISLATIITSAAIILVCCALIFAPLLERKHQFITKDTVKRPSDAKHNLEIEQKNIVRVIRELDEDFSGNKIIEKDYKELRSHYMNRAITILQELERLTPDTDQKFYDSNDASIERAILAERQKKRAKV